MRRPLMVGSLAAAVIAVFGMMSVSSAGGAVWYHSWHGAFIAMEDN